MDVNTKVSNWWIDNADYLISLITLQSKPLLFCLSFLLIISWLVGGKLTRFIKPEYPKLSTVIRAAGVYMILVSFMMTVVILLYSILILSFCIIGFYLLDKQLSSINLLITAFNHIWTEAKSTLNVIAIGSIVSLVASLYFKYFLIADWERGEGLHDIKKLVKKFAKLKTFNPYSYINLENGCFIGLSLKKNPIYIPWEKIRETHIQVLGSTGTGKGVVMSLIAAQSAFNGEGVIWIDPKFDRYSPKILRNAAIKAGKDFHMINLNPSQLPQFNILADAEAYEIEELLVAGFDLLGKGTDGDYHRAKDESAAILASKLAVSDKKSSIFSLYLKCRNVDEITAQDNFWGKLKKLKDLPALKTTEGLNLVEAIKKGSVIYIVGSTDNERVKMLQKMLLIRIIQIIKKQDRETEVLPICVILDEFKHILSPTALTGLGVVRDYNAHFLLAHQSLGDLDSCAGISRSQAEGAVLDNTAIKIIYKIGDSDHAKKLSNMSGDKSIFVERVSKSLDKNNSDSGGWQEANAPLINPDVLTHLPMPSDGNDQASTGVIFGIGTAKLFHVGPLPARGKMPTPLAAKDYIPEAPSEIADTELI